MSWIFIAIAVVFEVTVGIAAGKAQGFKNIPWTATTLIAGALGTYFLSLALLSFDVGVGYAIWTSVSGVGIVIVGALFLGQQLTWSKLLVSWLSLLASSDLTSLVLSKIFRL